ALQRGDVVLHPVDLAVQRPATALEDGEEAATGLAGTTTRDVELLALTGDRPLVSLRLAAGSSGSELRLERPATARTGPRGSHAGEQRRGNSRDAAQWQPADPSHQPSRRGLCHARTSLAERS